ncbi:hypothetical protein J4416_02215 [Candidatus Pacearchaeota archaeon]|nr:hypothetical protein [Candidatus Pacearchaeota archaeon]
MIKRLFLSLVMFLLFSSLVSAVLLSDQGTNVKNMSGSLLERGNLTITIYGLLTGENLIFNSTIQDAIVNGSWNIMMNPNLEYGKSYWKDYELNGEDLDFDGNERLEFQSPLGLINNISFINFSLINACLPGNSIRLIYSNGSVECETDDSGTGGADLTNYALKNQSETFSGNITTTQTGFFGWLGSLANRITNLFVQDIDASGNVNVTGNVTASYFIGDGSLLENLPAGSESDPIFVSENSTLWSVINSKLSSTDQKYNESALILSVNTTSNIMNLDFYNKSEVDSLISGVNGGNSTFNQSLTDTLYYSASNPSNFVNSTDLFAYNDTSIILTTNSSLWSYIGINEDNWLSTFNSTYNNLINQQCIAGYVVNGTLANGTFSCVSQSITETEPAWNGNYSIFVGLMNNGSYLTTYNYTYTTYSYNQTAPALTYADNINSTLSSRIDGISGDGSYNSTYAQWAYNQSDGSYNATYDIYSYNQTTPANTYTNSVNTTQTSWVMSTFLSITNALDQYFNKTEIQVKYYNKTEITSLGFVNSSGLNAYNETSLIDNINTTLSTRIDNLLTGGNSSFNQSLTDSLYSPIEWSYNMTTPFTTWLSTFLYNYNQTVPFTTWLSTFVYNYNQTTPAMDRANTINTSLSLRIDGISGGNASWNQTFANTLYAGAQWGYNQSDGSYNATYESYNTVYGKYWYNQTAGTYNSTYATWAYNQTIPAITNIDSRYWNKTQSYNITQINNMNASWITTYNDTYNNILNQQCSAGQVVNGTLSNGTFVCITPPAGAESDPIWSGNLTFGVSADLNPLTNIIQSLGSSAKRWLKGWFQDLDVSNNITVGGNVSAQYYYGSLNQSTFPTSACSGTDKVVSILANGTVNCGTDETSGGLSGTSFNNFNITLLDISTTDNGAYTEVLTLPLSNGFNILIECVLLQDAAVTGTGIHYESVLSGTFSQRQVMEYYSSASAQSSCSGTSSTLTCSPGSSSGNTLTPNRLYVYAVTSSVGTFTLSVKSETSNAVNVRAGSWCRSIET